MLTIWQCLTASLPPNLVLTAVKTKGMVMKSSQDDKALASLKEMENIIGYKFKKKFLLQQAFTHSSYQGAESYERLEYVGDSILNFLISKQQFYKYPNLPPGSLTALRAANVDTEKLARVAVKYNFHKYLRHENPTLSKQVCYSRSCVFHTLTSTLFKYMLVFQFQLIFM